MTNYPIISQKSLPKASRRGPMGLVSPRRESSELPLPNPHEAVVYKTAGSYVVDDGRSRTSDDHVVNATNISVVDMRQDAPVTVTATIPSAGATEFVVQVTFLCTVKKPEEVVEAGLADIAAALTNYLIQHQPLFHLGEDYQLDQITAVRHNVASEVKAYVNVRQARFRGLEVKLGSVQVMTPDELRSKQREGELEGLLTSDQQRREHLLAQQKADLEEARLRNEEEFELERRRHEQKLAQMRQQRTQMEEDFQQQLTQQKLAHDQVIRTSSFQHAAAEATRLNDALGGGDDDQATIFAGAIGERSIPETVDSMNAERERRREQDAADALRRDEWARDDKRERTRMDYTLEADRLKTQAEVVVAAVNRGLADHQNIEYLMSELRTVTKQLERVSATAAQQEKGRGERSEHPDRSPRPQRSDVPAAEHVIEVQIVADDPDDAHARGDDAEPEPREEDLGR
jgi:hypothetical protein